MAESLGSQVLTPLLAVERVTREFRAGASVLRAVDDVTFHVDPGETLGLVGESGCGKTTVGRLVLRLLPATAGRIVFDGRDITDLPERQLREFRRAVQVVFQDPVLVPQPAPHRPRHRGRAAPELRRHAPGGGRAGGRAARHGRPAARAT